MEVAGVLQSSVTEVDSLVADLPHSALHLAITNHDGPVDPCQTRCSCYQAAPVIKRKNNILEYFSTPASAADADVSPGNLGTRKSKPRVCSQCAGGRWVSLGLPHDV
jgi:hypothetical protein